MGSTPQCKFRSTPDFANKLQKLYKKWQKTFWILVWVCWPQKKPASLKHSKNAMVDWLIVDTGYFAFVVVVNNPTFPAHSLIFCSVKSTVWIHRPILPKKEWAVLYKQMIRNEEWRTVKYNFAALHQPINRSNQTKIIHKTAINHVNFNVFSVANRSILGFKTIFAIFCIIFTIYWQNLVSIWICTVAYFPC